MAYRGVTARLPVGAQGFTGTQNPSQAGPGHFLYTEGAELDAGIIRKDGGALMYNQTLPVHGGLLDGFVKIQHHFTGIDGNQNAFPDTNGVTTRLWTAAGNAQIDTADFKFSPSSLLLDGTGDWLTAPDSADFTLGSGDWTVDFWFKMVAAGGTRVWMCGQCDGAGTNASTSFRMGRSNTNVLDIQVCVGGSAFLVTGTTQFTNALNTGWHHFACVRFGNVLKIFIDGVQEGGDVAISGTVNDSANVFAVGTAGAIGNPAMNGWMDEFRLSVGVARWIQNFTPPTAAYADYTTEPSRAIVLDTDTKSLLHFEGADASTTFSDSAIPLTRVWTAAGNAQIDTADFKIGTSSGLFDGTGDWITTPDSVDFTLSSNNFTIEFWFKCNAAGGTQLNMCGQCDNAAALASRSFIIYRNTSNQIVIEFRLAGVNQGITSTNTFTNAVNPGWHHFAWVRNGNSFVMYIDGVVEGSFSGSGAINDSTNLLAIGTIGEVVTASWNGWIDEFRFVNGVAKWIAPFVPPGMNGTPYIVNGSNSGLVAFGALPTNVQTIMAGIFWPNSTSVGVNNDIIAVSGGAILAASAGGFSTICRVGLNNFPTDPPPYFMFAGGEAVGSARRLFLFSNNNAPQVTSAGTLAFTSLSSIPADWSGGNNFPTFGVLHAFRVFAGGNLNDPHRLYYSQSTDHTNFSGAGSGTLAIYPGEGEKIVGAVSFRGALIVWKYPNHIYVVDTTDPTPANWKVDRLTKAIGGVNQHSIVQIENDIAFLDRSGNIHLLSAVNEFGDLNTSNLSDVATIAPWIRANINMPNLQRAIGQWYAAKRQLWFGMPQLSSQVNNIRMETTFAGIQQQQDQQGGGFPPRFFLSRRDVLTALWSKADPANGIQKPMIGDDSGFIWYMDQDAKNKNGAAYAIQFQTASTDLAFIDQSLATKQKNGEFLELAYEPRGDWDLTVDIFWDDIYFETLFFNMGGAGGTLGSFVLDTDMLGSEGARSQRQRMEGSGRRFKMAAQNIGVNQDVSLSEFHISFSVGDERIQT